MRGSSTAPWLTSCRDGDRTCGVRVPLFVTLIGLASCGGRVGGPPPEAGEDDAGKPADAGAVATMEVADTDPMVAGIDPKSTTVAPEKPLPVMVTVVPPAAGPLLGLT